jgi:hypothetical protein
VQALPLRFPPVFNSLSVRFRPAHKPRNCGQNGRSQVIYKIAKVQKGDLSRGFDSCVSPLLEPPALLQTGRLAPRGCLTRRAFRAAALQLQSDHIDRYRDLFHAHPPGHTVAVASTVTPLVQVIGHQVIKSALPHRSDPARASLSKLPSDGQSPAGCERSIACKSLRGVDSTAWTSPRLERRLGEGH